LALTILLGFWGVVARAMQVARDLSTWDFSAVSEPIIGQQGSPIAGRRVMLVGKLASMSRGAAENLVRAHGGSPVNAAEELPDWIVFSDEAGNPQQSAGSLPPFDETLRARLASGESELLGESDLWARMGLVDSGAGVERLYTPAMLAKLVRVPKAAIRQWHRSGAILAKREVQRLPYFDFEEVRVARKLADLLAAGCTLTAIRQQLADLANKLPGITRPLAHPDVVVDGRRVYVRRDERLTEPTGQLLIEFDAALPRAARLETEESVSVAIPIEAGFPLRKQSPRNSNALSCEGDDLRALAAELQEAGQLAQAAEVFRAVLLSGKSTAEDQFALAELLYLSGDLAAARERYYAAIELDEEFVEARSNLGCVLAEMGESALAEAALRGALQYHPEYADAHYHLARLLDRAGRSAEASCHWQTFMKIAPASPWADEARDRLGEASQLSAISSQQGRELGARVLADRR